MSFRILIFDVDDVKAGWQESGEGPWTAGLDAIRFAETEVGVPWIVVQYAETEVGVPWIGQPVAFGDINGAR